MSDHFEPKSPAEHHNFGKEEHLAPSDASTPSSFARFGTTFFFIFFLSKASGQHDTEQDWGQHSLQSPERKYSPPNLPLIAFVRFRPRGFCGRDRTAAVQQGRKGKRLQRSMLVSEAFAAAAALMTHQMAPAKLPVVDKGVVTGTLLAGVGVYPPVRVCVCVPAAYKSHGP